MRLFGGNRSSRYPSQSNMKTTFGLYLSPLKDKSMGMVYVVTRVGGNVTDRYTTGIEVIKKYWKNPKVSSKHPNHLTINQALQNIIDSGPRQIGGDYKSCLLEYFNWYLEKRFRERLITNNTYLTYHKIRLVLEKGINRNFKSTTFPFEWLKDEEAVGKLKEVILKKANGKGFRSPRTSSNYLTVLKVVVKDWAESRGVHDLGMFLRIQIPWNRREVSKARFLTQEEIQLLRDYNPIGRAYKQVYAKSMFLFSLAASGQRVVDAITLRTTNFRPGYTILLKVKKVNMDFEVEFNYEMAEALGLIFSTQFSKVCSQVKVSEVEIEVEAMYKLLSKKGFVDNLGAMNLTELEHYVKSLKEIGWDKSSQHIEFWGALSVLVFEMRDEASKRFFELIRKLPSQFVFPYLNEEDFEGVDWGKKSYNLTHENVISRATKKYNRSLARMAKAMDMNHISSHVARHTWASDLQSLGYTIEQIQHSMNHSDYKSTKVYVETRFDNGVAKNVLKGRYQMRRSL